MPTSPKSPTAQSRLPSTPTSSKRAPQRLKPTPKRQLQTPKRLPATPQRPTKSMTPKRNPQTTPRVSVRKPSDDVAPLKTPKRNKDTVNASDPSQKRKSREPTVKTPLRVTKSAQRNVSKTTSLVEEENRTTPSASQKILKEKKKRKPEEMNAAKSKKGQSKPSAETDGDGISSQSLETPPNHPSSTKKARSASAVSNSLLKKRSSKKQAWSSKQRDVNDKPAGSAEKDAEQVDSARDQEETPKKQKTKKKRPAPGKFDLPTEDDDGNGKSSAKRSKKVVQVGKEGAILSPKITVNESMSESKLQLLECSPLNRLIAEQDRKAAAAEVAAQRKTPKGDEKKSGGLNSSASFIPIDRSTADMGRADELNALEIAEKKENRKKKSKGKEGRKAESLLNKDNADTTNKRGVMYLGHIPHGFYEKQMRSYFSQFGTVTKLKVSRSKKTGGSRGYAFLEFADPSVASIAAEAMDGYLMHGQSLVAKVVPDDKVHPETFKNAEKKIKKIPWSSIERRKMIARAKDPLKLAARSRRVKKVTKNRMKQLAKKGIKYDFPEISVNQNS